MTSIRHSLKLYGNTAMAKRTGIYCHDHPTVEMVKLKKKVVACPQCGRVRAKKYSKKGPYANSSRT